MIEAPVPTRAEVSDLCPGPKKGLLALELGDTGPEPSVRPPCCAKGLEAFSVVLAVDLWTRLGSSQVPEFSLTHNPSQS